MVSNSTATRKRYFHIPQVKSGVSALPNDSMNIAECTFMFGEWDIGFLVSISRLDFWVEIHILELCLELQDLSCI